MKRSRTGGQPSPERYIHIRNSGELATVRANLISYLFAGTLPSEVGTLSSVTSPIASVPNLDRCEKITMSAYPSRPRVWWPSTGNGDLILMHLGHTSGYTTPSYDAVIKEFVNQGYVVCGLVMPGGTETASGTTANHNADQEPLGNFVGPVVVAINTLVGAVTNIAMTGKSGGGWTTVFAAAVDQRITKSYPWAGTLPEYMHVQGRDWEQQISRRGVPATYLDLYLLGACPNRRQKQLMVTYDSCCFNIFDHGSGRDYSALIAARAAELDGDFDVVWVDGTTHDWNMTAVASEILSELT